MPRPPDIDTELAVRTANEVETAVDNFVVSTGAAEIVVRKNSGANVGQRPRLNLVEGSSITLTVVDDSGDNEIEITIALSSTPDVATEYRVAGNKVVGARGAAVADASGGVTVDAEARTALNALLVRLRTHGLIAP